MNISTIAPATPPAAISTPPGDTAPAQDFATALAAELPEPREGETYTATNPATNGAPGEVITAPAPHENLLQDPAMTVAPLALPPQGVDSGVIAPSPDGVAVMACDMPMAPPLQPGAITGRNHAAAMNLALSSGTVAADGQAAQSVSALQAPLAEVTEHALALENTAGSAPADPVTAGAGSGSTHPLAAAAAPGLALTPAAPVSATAPADLPRLDIKLPLQHSDWASEFSQRVVFSIGRGLQAAELRLNPEELGPISVKVSLDHNEASITFVTLHPQVRTMIEQALPLLRDSLQQAGLQLGEAAVSSGDLPQGQQRDGQAPAAGTAHNRRSAPEVLLVAAPAAHTASTLLIDTYA